MSRRDTIIIAVLVNAGLLAILFMMAFHVESERPTPQSPTDPHVTTTIDSSIEITSLNAPHEPLIAGSEEVIDEVDQAIQQYVEPQTPSQNPHTPQNGTLEVTVKQGDFLEKIANANGTTVKAIKQLNGLTSDRLSIGQVLKIPRANHQVAATTTPPQQEPEGQWYTVTQGDNPWLIAKKFNVKFNKLLEMNDLDEAKARNLKPGDRLRVK